MMADLSLDKEMLQEVIKKILRPAQKREAIAWLLETYHIGLHRGYRLMMQNSTVYNYCSCRDERAIALRIR
ncbi:hypothetical protein F7P84_19480 [Edwardsiella anguillarum]|nr:hypothetical protein F7P84_19480 [Edwardsiella anguillarum]